MLNKQNPTKHKTFPKRITRFSGIVLFGVDEQTMDIFHIETASLGTTRTNGVILDDVTNDQIPQVSFDGGPEFNLNFFDSPDDSNTGYSDPGSVDSTLEPSSPPTQPPTNTAASIPQSAFTTPAKFPFSIGMFKLVAKPITI